LLESLAISASYRLTLELITIPIIVAIVIIGFFLWSFVKGAGYEPVPGRILDEMIEFSQPGPGKQVYDLGSGFGRIIINVAQRTGASCTGVSVVKKNLLDADISGADMVFVFLWDGIMQKLKDKALREMKPGSVVVSYYHQFHGWEPERKDLKAKVYLYRIPSGGS
jgi:hypothetical protein